MITKFQISNQILWIDEAVLLVNKPAGMLTIRDGYNADLPYLVQILSKEFGVLWVVHRLDRDTSGVLLVARTAQAHQNLNRQFEQRTIRKTYHAITVGVPDRDRFTVDMPLSVDGDRRHRTITDGQNGKPASTEFNILEKYNGFCLLEAHPTTGYTHQIRAHLLAAGYPILSDSLYKLKTEVKASSLPSNINPLINRMALHAYSIIFSHPLTDQLLKIQAPYPQDLVNAINQLKEMI